jgi:acyl-CoA thioesterase II
MWRVATIRLARAPEVGRGPIRWQHAPVGFQQLFDLESHGPDTFVGTGPHYPWGGLYGGHIVAQALRAAALTVDDGMTPHSLRAYFIRRGDHTEPVRHEVDRIRNGKSFCTRRVVARQATGAILNLEASFQHGGTGDEVSRMTMPTGIPGPDELDGDAWTDWFDRRPVPAEAVPPDPSGAGRILVWTRAAEDLGSDDLLNRCVLAYISDDFPADAVRQAFPDVADAPGNEYFIASLDHTIWFHRGCRADQWLLHDVGCTTLVAGRGLSIGRVFSEDGEHIATVAQEALFRPAR